MIIEIAEISCNKLSIPEWYFGKDDTEIEAKLRNSIVGSESMGVLLVQKVAGGRYEILDGVKRWRITQYSGIKSVFCEVVKGLNVGDAMMMSLSRNSHWIEIDWLALAKNVGNITSLYPTKVQVLRLPYTLEQLNHLESLLTFDWNVFASEAETAQVGLFDE